MPGPRGEISNAGQLHVGRSNLRATVLIVPNNASEATLPVRQALSASRIIRLRVSSAYVRQKISRDVNNVVPTWITQSPGRNSQGQRSPEHVIDRRREDYIARRRDLSGGRR